MKWFKKIDFDGLNEEAEVIREEERQIAPGYTCKPEFEGRRKLPFSEVHIVEFYEQMVHKAHGGGRAVGGTTEKRDDRKQDVFDRFQNHIWAKGEDSEPITSPEEFQWALTNGTQFSPEEYIIPIQLNDMVLELYKRAHGLEISNITDQLDEYANTTAYWFHQYIQDEYKYCIQEQDYYEEVIPVFESILSGKDLVEAWAGREPNWFYRYSGYYLELVEACQRGNVESVNLKWDNPEALVPR
tara:strand:+ start:4122 stop:4847 length:726 start_codon:yes stop_codon:yes gene_type:complete